MKQKSICMKQIIYIVTTCVFISVSPVKAQRIYSLKDCLEEGLQNNYSLRIVHNEEQISKNNATLGNAGYLPTLDFSAGYTGNLDNIETKARATGEVTKNNGVYDQTVNVGLNLNWTIFDGFNISTTSCLGILQLHPAKDPFEELSLCDVTFQRTLAYSRSEPSCR